MKFKSIKRVSLLVLLICMMIPSVTFAADTYIGSDTLTMDAQSSDTTRSFNTDGGDFEVRLNGDNTEGAFSVAMYVNGAYHDSEGIGYTDGSGTVEFSGAPSGVVEVEVYSQFADTVEVSLYD